MSAPAAQLQAALESFTPVDKTELDPKLFLGVFENAQLMVGGKVSINGTLYPAEDTIRANEALQTAIDNGFIAPGQENHANPLEGPTFKLPVVLQAVRSVESTAGVVEVFGDFAVTNTTSGRDIHTVHQIGIPVGVSLNGFATRESHKLGPKSEFLSNNMEHAGETVTVRRNLVFNEMSPYDLVRMPSFNTFVKPATESVAAREAIERLTGEGVLKTAEESAQTPQQEPDMDWEAKFKALEAEFADFRQKAEESAKEAEKTNTAKEAAEAKVTDLTAANTEVAKALEAASNNANALQAKLEAAEAVDKTEEQKRADALEAQLKETQAALESIRVARETEQQAAKIAVAVNEHSEGDHQALVKEHLMGLVADGVLTDPDKVKEHADKVRGLMTRAAELPTGDAKVKPADEGVDGESPSMSTPKPGALEAAFINQMNQLDAGFGRVAEEQ